MGLLDRLLRRDIDDDSPVVERSLNAELRRDQLIELEDCLNSLADAMGQPGQPTENPGWRGRIQDYRYAAGGAAMVARQTTITPDSLADLLISIRPLYRGEPSAEMAGYAEFQQRLADAMAALEAPAPGEERSVQ